MIRAYRLQWSIFLLMLFGCAVTLAIIARHEWISLLRDTRSEAQKLAAVRQTLFQEKLHQVTQDVSFLTSVPPISGILRATRNHGYDAKEGSPIGLWEKRLGQIFEGYLRTNQSYFQVRYIGFDNQGQELIRVEHLAAIVIAPKDSLQRKGDRPYVRETFKLSPGEHYISPIDLNQEHGQIEVPLRPVLRVAERVDDEAGQPFGLIVVNMNASTLIDALKINEPKWTTYLINPDGYFLLHPERSKTFGFNLGRSDDRWGRQFVSAPSALANDQMRVKSLVDGTYNYVFRFPLQSKDSKHQPAELILSINEDQLFKQLQERVVDSSLPVWAMLFFGLMIQATLELRRRKLAHRDAMESNQELEARVRDRTSELKQDRELQIVLRELLEITLTPIPEREALQKCLARLMDLSWLKLLPKGAIFVRPKEANSLTMIAQVNMPSELRNLCEKVLLGKCLCGRVGATGNIEASIHVDARHEIGYPCMEDHGHIALPLMHEKVVIGVLTLYLPKGLEVDNQKRKFLETVAGILAGYILRKTAEDELLAHRDRLEETVISRTAELTATEARTRAILRTMLDGVVHIAGDGTILSLNDATLKMFGYEEHEVVGKNIVEFIPERWRQLHTKHLALYKPGNPSNVVGRRLEVEGLHRTGRVISIQLAVNSLEEDGVVSYIGGMQDITERKAGEEALRQATQQLEMMALIAETTDNAIVLTDRSGCVKWVNAGFTAVTGYVLEEVKGRKPGTFLQGPDTDPDTVRYIHEALEAGQKVETEILNYSKEGKPYWIQMEITPVLDDAGEVKEFIALELDITQRKMTEAAIQEAKERLEVAASAGIIGIWDWDVQKNELIWDKVMYKLYGIHEEEWGGAYDAWSHRIHPDDQEYVEGEIQAALSGERDYAPEFRVIWPDGSVHFLKAASRTIFDENAKAVRMVGVNYDMTEQKETEQALARAREAAEAASRAKGEFLANMSHEIRTPMNAVIGMARIGYRDSAGRNNTQQTFARILDAGQHLLGVINDILDFSKIEAGKYVIETIPFRPAEVIGNANSFVATLVQEKGITFLCDGGSVLPDWAIGDPQRLQQILTNLYSNAVKFTAKGSIRLDVQRHGDMTHFRVADTGIGMNAEQMGRLFQAFEQADTSTTRNFGGTGLGLAISQRLARLMGGEITVSSEPGVGTTFTLSVPLPETQPPVADAIQEGPGSADLSGYSILVAEDIDVNRMIIEDILLQVGARVVFAEDGRQAVERVKAEPTAFDIVLMDVQMPVMGGHEATKIIKSMVPDLPIIGLTAHALAEERARCEAVGMADHVTKPVEPDVLYAAIRRYCPSPKSCSRVTPSAIQSANSASGTQSDSLHAQSGLIDWERLLQRFEGRREFIKKLLTTAVRGQAETAMKLRAAAESNDLDALALLAHSLKGLGGNLKAMQLHDAGARAEDAARAGQADATDLARQLAELVDQLLSELRIRISQEGSL